MNNVPYRIVVIEDDPVDARLLRQAFDQQTEPHAMEVVTNLAQLDELLEHTLAHPEPSLVLLDLHFPLLDGVEILKKVKGTPHLSGIPVVVLTGDASPRKRDEVLALGASFYRLKPLNWDGMLKLAAEMLEECRRWKSSHS